MSPEFITFNPNIKSWSQAIARGAANFVGQVFEGMMAGAAIGAVAAGGAALAGSGSWAGAGRMALQFVKSIPKNFVGNIIESFMVPGLTLRGVMGAQNVAAAYGETGELSAEQADQAFTQGFFSMETGTIDSVKNVCTGNGTWQDYVGLFLNIMPVGKGVDDFLSGKWGDDAPKVDGDAPKVDGDNPKVDGDDAPKSDDADSGKPRTQADGDSPTQKAEGDAYEMGLGKFEGDPARDYYGSGIESHPVEWQAIIDDLKAQGVEISYRDGTLAYSPALGEGGVGQIILDPNASYSALLHEYQHFLDDMSNGKPGLGEYMQNQDLRAQMEIDAYNKEIELANADGNTQLAQELESLKQNEIDRIYGTE